jgi:hypothetical protein
MTGLVDEPARSAVWHRVFSPAAASSLGFSPFALPCGVVGFLLVLAAEFLPWFTVSTTVVSGTSQDTNVQSVGISAVQSIQTLAYYPLWAAIFGCAATAIAVPGRMRRIASAASVGLLAGQSLVLVSLSRPVSGQLGEATTAVRHLDKGLYAAFAAVVAILLAVLFSGSTRRPGLLESERVAGGWTEQPAVAVRVVPVSDLTVLPDEPASRGG